MNDLAMLQHIIQCRSKAIFQIKNCGGKAEMPQEPISKLMILKWGGKLSW
jgi:hypothetical protein